LEHDVTKDTNDTGLSNRNDNGGADGIQDNKGYIAEEPKDYRYICSTKIMKMLWRKFNLSQEI